MLTTYTQFHITSIFNYIQQLLLKIKDLDKMADDMNRNRSCDCHRFHDGTSPVCAVEATLGHMCQPCLKQNQTAQALLGSQSPRTQRMLLRRENRNLQMVRRFTDMEHRLVVSETLAWREAVASKEAKVAMMQER